MEGLQIRVAKAEDKKAILAFCENTWEDSSDYIHIVWDQWFSQSHGVIFVALFNSIPVGMARIVLLSDHETWWEGFRVDPAYRGRGIGSLLEAKRAEFVLEKNIKISRSLVSSKNTIRNQMMLKRRRKKVACYCDYDSISLNDNSEKITNLIQCKSEDFDLVLNVINNSDYCLENYYLYDSNGLKYQKLTNGQLKISLKMGKVWGWKDNNKLSNIAIESYAEETQTSFWIGYIAGKIETFSSFFIELRRLAFQKNYHTIKTFFPINENLTQVLIEAGYYKGNLGKHWLYEWNNF